MKPAVMMGDPLVFRIQSGSNPHTRTSWGFRKKVNRERAVQQWHGLASLLTELGVYVFVIPPISECPAMVYPANAGFLWKGRFYLSNLISSRQEERGYYQEFVKRLGFPADSLPYRFEGEADFFPVGERFLFTYGVLREQGFQLRFGFPPWKRIYSFRSDQRNFSFLKEVVAPKGVDAVELIDSSHYHGDTVFCSFGTQRQFLLAYLSKVSEEGANLVRSEFGENLIPLSDFDGRKFAANSFYTETEMGKFLLIPEGLSLELIRQIETQGIVPCPVDVSEFMTKGGGSVKCMVCDLGLMELKDPAQPEEVRWFRKERLYR